MYKKVIAIKKEINDGTIKVPYALKTLDAIAQYALQQGDMNSKRLADEAFALLPLYKEKADELDDALTSLQVSIAQPIIERLTKKLIEKYDYDPENFDNTNIGTFFTDNGTLVLWLLDRWSDKNMEFKVNSVIIDNGKDEIIECEKLVKDDTREDDLTFIMAGLRDLGY